MKTLSAFLSLCVCLAIVCSTYLLAGETFDWSQAEELYPGMKHMLLEKTSPRRLRINIVRLDTRTPGMRFYATERVESWEKGVAEIKTQRTRDFLYESRQKSRDIVLAINAGPGWDWGSSKWNKSYVSTLGQLHISEGVVVSEGKRGSFVVDGQGSARIDIVDTSEDVSEIHIAVAAWGGHIVLSEGVASGGDTPHPRTGIGVCKDERFVYFMVVDGRQLRSRGIGHKCVGEWLAHFGAWNAINVDGGGSSTMVRWNPEDEKAELLNTPVGNGFLRGTERYVGANLGVYYEIE